MKTSIVSKKLNQILTFSRSKEMIVYVDINNLPDTLGRKICNSGCLLGSHVLYHGDDEQCFREICQKWLAKYESMIVF